MPIRAVLFDFDGTLADSFGAITESVNHVRESYGLEALTENVVREYVGLGLEQLMKDLVPVAPPEEAVDRYRAHHARIMIAGTRLLPGVAETVQLLHARGLKLGVCSNKAVAFTKSLVAGLGLAPVMAEVLGPDDVGVPKPDPALLLEGLRRLKVSTSDAVYIGDMAVDVHAARAAGMPVWLVPGGAVGRENPLDAHPDRLLKSFAELIELLPSPH